MTDAAPAVERPGSWTRRRSEVIATASRLVSERGYRGISMERLAEELQVSKPTIYYYVNSKTDLWAALVDLATANANRLREECLAIDDPVERLEVLIRRAVQLSTGEMRWTTVASDRDNFPDDIAPEIAEQLLAAARTWFHTVITVVRDSIVAGVLPDLDPILTALNIIAMPAWCAKWYGRDYLADPEAIEASILGLIVRER